MDSKSGLENVDKLIQIYRQLANCSSSQEVEALKRRLKEKSIHAKNVLPRKRKMEEVSRRDKNVGQNRMSAVAHLGKEIDNLTVEAEKLIARGGFTTEELTVEVPRKIELPATELVGEDSNRYAQEIWEFLKMKEGSTIGVWGMGGVGKTSLVTHVYNYASKHLDLFGSVYWVTVSNDCSIHELQRRIAKRVKEDLSDEDDERLRAGRLMEALEQKGKFTIFLDDMWEYFDLISAGIPKINGCKLILTTRWKRVCHKMECDKIVEVRPLHEKDARDLFFKSIGHEIPNEIIEIATLVVKECGGLPLAIITLSRSMRKCYDIPEWKSVLNKLKKSNPDVDDMEKKVFDVLRLSFYQLNNSKLKECLLHCATYPENFKIPTDELIWRFIDEGLLDMDANTREMFDEGHAILNELVGAALLSRNNSYRISMHDLIRDMTLQIAGFRFMVKACVGLEDFPHEKNWTDKVELVSLVKNDIRKTSDLKLKCRRLSTLLLQNNYLKSLSDSFFENLRGLKVLDLSFTGLRALPTSILSLKELTSFNLRRCMFLKIMPNLASLSSLQRLNLSYSGLTEVPQGVEDLINLIYLNFLGTKIRGIDPSVLRRLNALEVLGIPKFDMNVQELTHLKKLEHVEIIFDRIEIFTAFVKHMQMNGKPSSYFLTLDKRAALRNYLFNMSKMLNPDMKRYFAKKFVALRTGRNLPMLPGDVQDLEIVGNEDVTSLVRLQELKSPLGSGAGVSSFFSFSNLRTLVIDSCPKIKELFSVRLVSYLQNIEKIEIRDCMGLEEIIVAGNDGMVERHERKIAPYTLPNLITLGLRDLPELKSICGSEGVLECVSLQKIEIAGCPKLRRMPFSLHNQQPRVNLYGSDVEWVNTLEWDPPGSKSMVEIHIPLIEMEVMDRFAVALRQFARQSARVTERLTLKILEQTD